MADRSITAETELLDRLIEDSAPFEAQEFGLAEPIAASLDPAEPESIVGTEPGCIEVHQKEAQLVGLGAELRAEDAHRRDIVDDAVLPALGDADPPADRGVQEIKFEAFVRHRPDEDVPPEEVAMDKTRFVHVADLLGQRGEDLQFRAAGPGGAWMAAEGADERYQ